MGYTKRKTNSKCKVSPDNAEKIKSNFLADIRAAAEKLVINWDYTATVCPSS